MKLTFNSKGKEKTVDWVNGDYTVIVADETDSKREVLVKMIDWCNVNSFEYVTYNLDEVFDIKQYLAESTTFEIVSATLMIKRIFTDLDRDFDMFSKARNIQLKTVDDYLNNIDLVKEVLMLCGSGYTKIFIMFLKAIKAPTAGYYFLYLPETSLHFMVFQKLLELLLVYFRHLKVIFASNYDRLEDSAVFHRSIDFDKANIINLNRI